MIVVEQQGNIATITLSNPEKRNRLTVSAMRDMTQSLKELNSNPEVRVVVITGAGENLKNLALCISEDRTRPTVGFALPCTGCRSLSWLR